jgi:hypothetical protein
VAVEVPVVFHIPAAGVVFGYSKGSYFKDWYETSEEAEETFEKCRERVALERQERTEPEIRERNAHGDAIALAGAKWLAAARHEAVSLTIRAAPFSNNAY